ncbi:helix-turn-helix domain-containing protein [Peribacillus frigoritolerans]|uniref:helix-turn-helix domain-containing protein n=1 Tax=Peribacillus frigoritolerans TaxID=450367 RepID=UPI0037F495DC
MDVLKQVEAFLSSVIIHSPFQVWISLDSAKFELILSKNSSLNEPPSQVLFHHSENGQILKHKEYQDIHYAFPNRFHIVIRCFSKHEWSEQEIGVLSTLFYPYYLEKILERQKYTLNIMMNSIRDISVLQDVDYLLTKILENALSVIPVADMGVLWMYDTELKVLTPRAWAGGPNVDIQKMRMKVGEGIIGKTFQENKSQIYTNMDDILRASSTMTDENFSYLNSSYNFKNVQSVISVPIIVAEMTMCVLIIYQNGKHPLLSTYDKQLLESFSDQVSIALMNSRLFQDLKQQNQLLIQRDEIHHTFMKLSLQSKGIQNIVNELRRMINTSITIVDFIDDQYYSSTSKWPNSFQINSLNRIFSTIRTPTFHSFNDSDDCTTFYIQPIIAVDTCLGLIVVEANVQELPPLSKMVLEQSSSVIALEMIKKQTLADSFYKKTNDFFHDFLLCRENGLLRKKAIELGINQNSYFLSALIQLQPQTDIQLLNLQVHRLVSEIKGKFHQLAPVVFGFHNKVTVLFQFQEEVTQTHIDNQLHNLLTKWSDSDDNSLLIGIGTCSSDLEKIAKSYGEADKALSYLISRHQDGIMHYQDIGINRLFIHHPQEELDSFVDEIFNPLRTDKDKDNDLEKTLLVYIETNRSASQTSNKLHIHVNTLYQRLKKIEEKVGISFSDNENVLKLQLACYLYNSNNQ